MTTEKKQQRERASNRLEMFLVSICVWLNMAACERLYETGGITNEGGEKTILQSNNMVALRVIYLHLDRSKVWYGTICKTTFATTFDGWDRNVHIPTRLYLLFLPAYVRLYLLSLPGYIEAVFVLFTWLCRGLVVLCSWLCRDRSCSLYLVM
jgi:hypothetical protein